MPKSVAGVMHEWKHGELHSGSSHGPVVHSRQQAIAIALSEQRQQGGGSGPSGHGAAVKHAIGEHAKGHVSHLHTK